MAKHDDLFRHEIITSPCSLLFRSSGGIAVLLQAIPPEEMPFLANMQGHPWPMMYMMVGYKSSK